MSEYTPSSQNDLSFNCEYNAPIGQINLIFPDTPCAALDPIDFYSGESLELSSLLSDDPYSGLEGSELYIVLSIYKDLPIDPIHSGETASSSLYVYTLFDPIGLTGETGSIDTLTLPEIITFDFINESGEETSIDLATTISFVVIYETGESGLFDFIQSDYGYYILSSENPIAYWKFNETSGEIAIDSTGNHTEATIVSATIGHTSPVASHFSFYLNGTSSLVNGSPTSIASSNVTQELWIKPDSDAIITLFTPSSTGTQGLSGQRYAVYPYQNGSGSGGGISIGSNGIQVVAYGLSYCPILLSYQQSISTSEYTHVLVSWNDRTPTLYVNGVSVATGFQARAPFAAQGLPSSWLLGSFKGYIQDVALYDYALTSEQAREHYLAGIGLHYIPHFENLISYTSEILLTDVTIDLTPLGTFSNYTSEVLQTSLENNFQFNIDNITGETLGIKYNLLDVIPNSTFTFFYGNNTHSETSSCLTLDSAESNTGINAGFYLPESLNLQSISQLYIRFKRTRATSWYQDNDYYLTLAIYPNWLTSEIIWSLPSGWYYQAPRYTSGGNAQSFIIYFNHNESRPIKVYWFQNSTTIKIGTLSVISNFSESELDGTNDTTVKIVTSNSETVVTVYGSDQSTIRQQGTFSTMPNIWANNRSTTNDIVLFHYHNHKTNDPEILCDIKVYEDEGFALSTVFSLGSPNAYTGESAVVDALNLSTIFTPDAYSGEVSLLNVLTIYPSIDLGIVTNYSGEDYLIDLLTSSIIEIPFITDEILDIDLTFYPSEGIGVLQGNSGERQDLDFQKTIIFRDLDVRDGQDSNVDFTTFPPALLYPVASIGENSLFDLSIELAIEILGYVGEESQFILDFHPSIDLDNVYQYSDENLIVDNLTISYSLPLTSSTGENFLFDYTPAQKLELDLYYYTGEINSLLLSSSVLLLGNGYSGQHSLATLSIFNGETIVPIFYPGTWSSVTLRTSDRLVSQSYSGNNTVVFLTNYPSTPIEPIGNSGEYCEIDLLLGITFPSIAFDGINVVFDLDYVVNTGMPAGWYDGESVEFTIATTEALSITGYSGEETLVNLGAGFALYPLAYSGSYVSVSLTLNPFDVIDGLGYNGQIGQIELSTTTSLPNRGYSGENIIFDFQQSLSHGLSLDAKTGNELEVDLRITFQLPVGRSYTGSLSVVDGMDNEPNTYFYSNNLFEIKLSTTDVLRPTNIDSGETCFTILEVGKSKGLGLFNAYPGTTTQTSLDVIYHADFYVLFRTSVLTQVDIGSTTYFDLSTDFCCGIRRETLSNNLNLNLAINDYFPESVAGGSQIIMEVDLRCNPRFSVDYNDGTVFELRDYKNYLSINFETGAFGFVNGFDSDLSNKLCKGYFIPNGNWVVIEINDVLPEECYTDVLYEGTTMSCVLSDDIVLRIERNGTSEALIVGLDTTPPWLLKFYSGEKLEFELAATYSLYPRFSVGENTEFSFYEPPIMVYFGETVECDITTIYHVRFKESGCLDNDFVFQNADGDLIAEMTNPVPVEGEPFYHSVLAECF